MLSSPLLRNTSHYHYIYRTSCWNPPGQEQNSCSTTKVVKNDSYGICQEGERSDKVGTYSSHLGQRRGRGYHKLWNTPGGARIWGQSLGTPALGFKNRKYTHFLAWKTVEIYLSTTNNWDPALEEYMPDLLTPNHSMEAADWKLPGTPASWQGPPQHPLYPALTELLPQPLMLLRLLPTKGEDGFHC